MVPVRGSAKPKLGELTAKTPPATNATTGEAAQPAASDEGVGEEAELAASAVDVSTADSAPSASADDEGYVWPEGAEQVQPNDDAAPIKPPERNKPELPLPSVDELAKRIPPEVKETLEDLFRAKFVSAKRVSPKTLKGPPKHEASA